jgi:hypothetical protein
MDMVRCENEIVKKDENGKEKLVPCKGTISRDEDGNFTCDKCGVLYQ